MEGSTAEVREMKHKNTSYDTRYKHKLNMLGPGLIIVKIIGALFASGVAFWVITWRRLSIIFWTLSGILLVVLLVLVAIEGRQDSVLNEIAKREKYDLEKRNESK